MASSTVTDPDSPTGGALPGPGTWVAGAGLALEARSLDERALGRIRLGASDLAPWIGEIWREQCLRHGHLVALDALECRVGLTHHTGKTTPVLHWQGPGSAGHAPLDPGTLVALERLLESRCLAAGLLREGQQYVRRWVAEIPDPGKSSVSVDSPFRLRGRAPDTLAMPLENLRRWAVPRGKVTDAFPVFIPADVATRIHHLVRRGEQNGIETGAALAGVVLAGSEQPDLGVLVTEAFALEDTVATATALELKGTSWARVQAVIRARRTARPDLPEILVGQAHLHPFLPGRCPSCSKRTTCGLHTAMASSEDDAWMQAVFSAQPWALCLIGGFTPRHEPVDQLFTLAGGRLAPRGYHVLPDAVVATLTGLEPSRAPAPGLDDRSPPIPPQSMRTG